MYGPLLVLGVVIQAITCFLWDMSPSAEEAQTWEPLHYLLYGRGIESYEWNSKFALRTPVYVLVLSGFGYVYKMAGLSRVAVMASIRLTQAIAGLGVSSYFFRSTGLLFGNEIPSMTGFALFIFSNFIAGMLSRLSEDTMLAFVAMASFGLLLNRRHSSMVFLSIGACFLSLSYIPIFATHLLLMFLASKGRRMQVLDYISQPFGLGIGFWGCAFGLTESRWYGEFTLTAWNNFKFAMWAPEYFAIPLASPAVYLNVILAGNTPVIVILAIIGMVARNSLRRYALPFLVGATFQQLSKMRESGRISFLIPILCAYAGNAILALLSLGINLEDEPDKKKEEPVEKPSGPHPNRKTFVRKVKRDTGWWGILCNRLPTLQNLKFLLVFVIIAGYSIFGISGLLSTSYRFTGSYAHYKGTVEQNFAAYPWKADVPCVVNYPYSSWWLPEQCRLYVVTVLDEEFLGQYDTAFRRFENETLSAYIPIGPPGRLRRDHQKLWNDVTELTRVADLRRNIGAYSNGVLGEVQPYQAPERPPPKKRVVVESKAEEDDDEWDFDADEEDEDQDEDKPVRAEADDDVDDDEVDDEEVEEDDDVVVPPASRADLGGLRVNELFLHATELPGEEQVRDTARVFEDTVGRPRSLVMSRTLAYYEALLRELLKDFELVHESKRIAASWDAEDFASGGLFTPNRAFTMSYWRRRGVHSK